MNKKIFSSTIFFLVATLMAAQNEELPLKVWSSSDEKPLVFYISGDGGYSSFSDGVCTTINKAGYKLVSLNSKSYFDHKKTPQQTTNDIASYLDAELKKRKDQKFVLFGYSFGADIVPFVVNLFTDSLKKKLGSVVLLSPSTSTDFETHFLDMFGWTIKRNMDVVAEINKMEIPKVAIVLANDENDFPLKDIKLKNYKQEHLSGSHHYDGNSEGVAKTVMKYF